MPEEYCIGLSICTS